MPQTPTPRQAEFLALDCLEALYGGAAGGGKSSALLMAAAQHVHVPGYAALLLRRTYADLALPGAIMDRSKEWWNGKAQWNDKDKRWTFPSGATITFGYLDTDRDRYRYQGAELQFIGFDELTQFPEQWYRYLLSRLRRLSGGTIPLRARAASNPGGVGHDWVRRRFVENGALDERAFVPATLGDNPHLDADSYRRSLEQLDPTTRRQLLDGSWIRDSGGLVYQYEEAKSNVEEAPACSRTLLALDFGFTDATAFAVLGWRDHDPNVYVLRCWKQTGMTPSDVGEEVAKLEASHHFDRIVGDIGGLGKGYAEEARRRFNLPIEAAEKANKRGYQNLLNGDLSRGRVKVVRSACEPLIKEWLELPWREDRSKEAEGFDNHCADALLYGWRAAFAFLEEPAPNVPTPGTPEAYRAEAEKMIEARIAEVSKTEDDAGWQDF